MSTSGEDRAAGPALELDQPPVPADQFLCCRKAEAGTVGPTGHQWIEDGVLQVRRDTRPVILDLDVRHDRVPDVADGEIQNGASSQDQVTVTVQRDQRVANKVEQRLHHLVAIQLDVRQTRVVIALDVNALTGFRFDQANHILDQLVDVLRLLVWRAAGTEQRVDEPGKAVGFADDHVGVFTQFVTV